MHIADGLLPVPVLAAGGLGTGALAWWGARELGEEEPPRLAVFTAAFFCVSLIHFPVPPTSVHLLLHGLLGVVLGRRALLALPVGLGLQAALLGHGRLTTLGVNALIMGMAAMAGRGVYRVLAARPGVRPFWSGAAAGAVAVAVSGALVALVLAGLGGGFRTVAQLVLLAHMPVLGLEAAVTGLTVEFLRRVQPALVRG